MKTDANYFERLNKGRLCSGPVGSRPEHGNNGAFLLRIDDRRRALAIISDCSDMPEGAGPGWEHVSLRVEERRKKKWHSRIPTWEEMCWAKEFFWGPEACVVQYHPPEADYVNQHPHVLHLWRPVGIELSRPPKWMVGIRNRNLEPRIDTNGHGSR